MKTKLRNQKGFTIIEVLIVLAIAGLILLIVFLAVPALQRNSRNTQIRNDAASVLGSVNEYSSNNNGSLPGYVCADTANGNLYMGSGAVPATCNTGTLAGKIRGGVTVSSVATAVPAAATQTIVVHLDRKCNGNGVAAASSNRAFAASYQAETAGGATNQCVES